MRWQLFPFLVLFTGLQAQAEPQVEKAATPSKFIRLQKTDDLAMKLEAACVTYTLPGGKKVSLIGAVHVADEGYYQKLNERFKKHDALLYELVGEPVSERGSDLRSKDPKNDAASFLGAAQQSMKHGLDLAHQMEHIDYRAPNFVHADLSWNEFTQSMEKRDENVIGLMLRSAFGNLVSQTKANQTEDMALALDLVSGKQDEYAIKRFFAVQLERSMGIMPGMENNEKGTALIGARNDQALKVLDEQLALGKKNCGIFYGAAHMPDMESKLRKRGAKVLKTEWLTAWDIPAKTPEP
jgi:hypothetical protein